MGSIYRVYKKNAIHLCLIISEVLKLIGQFWTCFKQCSFLFRTSCHSYFYCKYQLRIFKFSESYRFEILLNYGNYTMLLTIARLIFNFLAYYMNGVCVTHKKIKKLVIKVHRKLRTVYFNENL